MLLFPRNIIHFSWKIKTIQRSTLSEPLSVFSNTLKKQHLIFRPGIKSFCILQTEFVCGIFFLKNFRYGFEMTYLIFDLILNVRTKSHTFSYTELLDRTSIVPLQWYTFAPPMWHCALKYQAIRYNFN